MTQGLISLSPLLPISPSLSSPLLLYSISCPVSCFLASLCLPHISGSCPLSAYLSTPLCPLPLCPLSLLSTLTLSASLPPVSFPYCLLSVLSLFLCPYPFHPHLASSTHLSILTFSFHLLGLPGLTTKHPVAVREVLARLHEEAQLLAELSDQAAAVTWLKDGQVLPAGPKYEVQASARQRALVVRDVAQDDAGLYECVSRGDRIAYQLLVEGVYVSYPPGPCHSHSNGQALGGLGSRNWCSVREGQALVTLWKPWGQVGFSITHGERGDGGSIQ